MRLLLILLLFPMILLSPPIPTLISPGSNNPQITLPLIVECIKSDQNLLHFRIEQEDQIVYEAHYLQGCYYTIDYLSPGAYQLIIYSSGDTPETFSPEEHYPFSIPEQHVDSSAGCNFSLR